jgi:heavy metal sensor kinase
MNTRSIQFRLILWYSGMVIAVLLAFGYYTYVGVRSQLYSNLEHTLTRRAQQISANVLPHVAGNPADMAAQIRAVYSPEANNRFIRITNADHGIIYVSSNPQDGRFNPANIPPAEANAPAMRMEPLSYNDDMLITTTRAEVDKTAYLIEMGAPTEEIDQTLHGLVLTLLWGLPVIILMVSAGGYVLVKRALQPVENISATAQKITFGNLSNRVPIATTGDAIEHLSITLNKMLDRLENAYDQASRFSADASHELRTPLTIMRGELESLTHAQEMPEPLQERVGSVLEETERLSRITENLFAISRLDAGVGRAKPITFYLIDLVKSTTDQMLLLAEVKAITLCIEAKNAVKVTADESRLKQVIVNLVDNAIKYTPSGGKVSIVISESHHKAYLSVTDTGIGIPAEALPHIFERFYRADKARSRDDGGAGLGLSIVRSIVQAHGGTIEVESAEGKGTIFKVTMPLAEVNYEIHQDLKES